MATRYETTVLRHLMEKAREADVQAWTRMVEDERCRADKLETVLRWLLTVEDEYGLGFSDEPEWLQALEAARILVGFGEESEPEVPTPDLNHEIHLQRKIEALEDELELTRRCVRDPLRCHEGNGHHESK